MNTLHVINLMTYINEHVLMAFLENELEARQKSIDAQFSSSIDSDKGGKRKRNR